MNDTQDQQGDRGRLLLMPEISEMTRIPEGTLRYLRHCGRGPLLFKSGGRLVAWEADVRTYLAEQEAAGQEHYAAAGGRA